MAVKKKEIKYVSKAITTEIQALCRMSVKLKDNNFYTFEFLEKRQVPSDANLGKEREVLWDTCYEEVNSQIDITIEDVNGSK
jgi:hypothetical protein